jgi:hypothetical protein
VKSAEQHYDGNTPILVTTLRDGAGGAIEAARLRAALLEPRPVLPADRR